ncbi:hypothetical protein Asi03nite_24680 [Actinoplanes siamensis]|uniref:Uncharacterized protein n=1 Tax=Actinoplanes siamensis TaxID=1223317 RepID=A0A919TK78_9ACTN|nr:hypothetical protein Asi03nite_24680 [Actinoplanes siamensis]
MQARVSAITVATAAISGLLNTSVPAHAAPSNLSHTAVWANVAATDTIGMGNCYINIHDRSSGDVLQTRGPFYTTHSDCIDRQAALQDELPQYEVTLYFVADES